MRLLAMAFAAFVIIAGCSALVTACTAEADDPGRSLSQARQMICHEAIYDLQHDEMKYSDAAYDSSYAYLLVFVEQECGR